MIVGRARLFEQTSARAPRPHRSRQAAVLGLACLLALPAWAARPPTLVEVNAVEEGPVAQTLPVIGRTVARESGVVAASVAGPVANVKVHVGDRLKAGDIIAQLVDDRRRAELDRRIAELNIQQARIRTATARLGLAVQERDRLKKLKGSAAFPKASYEDKRQEAVRYRSELVEAQAAVGRAEADQRIARIELERTVVRAPFPGVVTMRHASAGAYLRIGERVVSLVNDNDLEIEAEIPAARLGGLRIDTELDVEIAGVRHRATVRAIVPNENPLTRTRQVRLTPKFTDANAPSLADNQSVVLHIPIGTTGDVVSVHKDAIINRRGKRIVYVVAEDAAEVRPVELGEAVGARFVVLNGLKPGELVVIRGNERLRPGQKVRYEAGS
ncbi:MAG: efflux RND transporter periplasmic adaptor subunit [Gammaproteobacteria bacterium]|nr:efflux RND transporter periplasmic adaptor subunit [Gammaproteobacteria bacterium]